MSECVRACVCVCKHARAVREVWGGGGCLCLPSLLVV